jgi:signal transduction histidine kinase
VINFIRPDIKQCIVFADRTQIVRVFNNLIKNSIQAISATNNGKIDIHISKENNHFIIRVADNGVGIAEEQKEKIFSPNFTTKTGGTGLGLAMVKSIVEGYGGKIWFESKVNAGTAFFIELPEKES